MPPKAAPRFGQNQITQLRAAVRAVVQQELAAAGIDTANIPSVFSREAHMARLDADRAERTIRSAVKGLRPKVRALDSALRRALAVPADDRGRAARFLRSWAAAITPLLNVPALSAAEPFGSLPAPDGLRWYIDRLDHYDDFGHGRRRPLDAREMGLVVLLATDSKHLPETIAKRLQRGDSVSATDVVVAQANAVRVALRRLERDPRDVGDLLVGGPQRPVMRRG